MSKQYLCPFPGCMSIVPCMGRFCHSHADLQSDKDRKERERATARWDRHHDRIDYSWVWQDPRWRRLRASQLKRRRTCARCGEPATTVDHIIPHRGDMDLAFNTSNLQSLCARCGNIKSREDRDSANPYPPSEKRGRN